MGRFAVLDPNLIKCTDTQRMLCWAFLYSYVNSFDWAQRITFLMCVWTACAIATILLCPDHRLSSFIICILYDRWSNTRIVGASAVSWQIFMFSLIKWLTYDSPIIGDQSHSHLWENRRYAPKDLTGCHQIGGCAKHQSLTHIHSLLPHTQRLNPPLGDNYLSFPVLARPSIVR